MKKITVAAAVAAAVAAGAADKYAADWMSYGAGARALGMGGAYVALAEDATAPYWNPAGMPGVERAAFSAMHSYAYNGLASYDAVYGAYNAGAVGAVGGGMLRFAVDDIPWTDWEVPGDPDSRPELKGYFNWADYAFYGSYGRRLAPWFNAGASAVILYGSHYRSEWGSSGEALDVAARAGPFGPLTLGLNAQNVFGRLKWGTGTVETIPPNVKFGGAYRYVVEEWSSEFTAAADCDARFAGYGDAAQLAAGPASFDFHAGGEWAYRRTVAVRVGSERGALTGGVGLTVRALGASFGIDYAYLADTGLDASHRVSASVAF